MISTSRFFIIICFLTSATAFGQSQKQKSPTHEKSQGQGITNDKPGNMDYIGNWKLISQRVTYPNGQIFMGDSTNIHQHKIITHDSFVIIIEKEIPNYNNKRLATSVAGGRFTINKGNYQEFTQYASWKGFEVLKINGKLTVEQGKLHLIANLNNYVRFAETTIFDEWYIREE